MILIFQNTLTRVKIRSGFITVVLPYDHYILIVNKNQAKSTHSTDRDYQLMMVHRTLLVVVKTFEFKYPFPVISIKTSNEVE